MKTVSTLTSAELERIERAITPPSTLQESIMIRGIRAELDDRWPGRDTPTREKLEEKDEEIEELQDEVTDLESKLESEIEDRDERIQELRDELEEARSGVSPTEAKIINALAGKKE